MGDDMNRHPRKREGLKRANDGEAEHALGRRILRDVCPRTPVQGLARKRRVERHGGDCEHRREHERRIAPTEPLAQCRKDGQKHGAGESSEGRQHQQRAPARTRLPQPSRDGRECRLVHTPGYMSPIRIQTA